MSITVKDVNGETKDIRGGGFGLGLAGTIAGGLALLNQGGIGGIVGGGMNTANAGTTCMVTEREFFTAQIGDVREMYNNNMAISDRICALESRVSTDEAVIAKNFEIENMRADYENKLMHCYVDRKTCDFLPAYKSYSPSQLSDPYVGTRLVLGSRQVPYCGGGYDNGCGGGYDNGCGCNGYGF